MNSHTHCIHFKYIYIVNLNSQYSMDEREEKLVEQGRRVESIINDEGLTQAEFSELTGIKTSTLNHVIKGRNNISPMVMYQILSAFPIYNEEWIRSGQGERTKDINSTSNTNVASGEALSHDNLSQPSFIGSNSQRTLFSANSEPLRNNTAEPNQDNSTSTTIDKQTVMSEVKRSITKIIVYYDDNTFETFTHSTE